MGFKSLKIHIMIHIAVLLIIGMLITDIVVTTILKKDLLAAQVSKTDFIMVHMKETMSSPGSSLAQKSGIQDYLETLADKSVIHSACFADSGENTFFSGNAFKDTEMERLHQREIRQTTFRAINEDKRLSRFFGKTWGVFWLRDKYLLVSYPLEKRTGVSFIVPLADIYTEFFEKQKIIFFYILLNTAFLCFIGLLRISKIVITPIKKLTNIVKAYDGEGDPLYMLYPSKDEFGTLSLSLNSMVNRIAEDRQKLENSLNQLKNAQAEIIRAEKMSSIGKLSAGVAHEIGNPIGIILGYLELLKQDTVSEADKKDFLDRTETEIQRIDKIIRRLLDFSRKTDSEHTLNSVHRIIEETVNIVKEQSVFSRIDLDISLKAPDDTVLSDSNRLKQVFVNLILNAVDAILTMEEKEGCIAIESSHTADKFQSFLEIRISDNGPGIAEEHLGNIFDPFYTTKEPGFGTGLGLWVCYMIVDDMNGSIKAENKPGQGAAFVIELPLEKRTGRKDGENESI